MTQAQEEIRHTGQINAGQEVRHVRERPTGPF